MNTLERKVDLKKIDQLVILASDDGVQTLNLPEGNGGDEMFATIMKDVDALNSGILDVDGYTKHKNSLRMVFDPTLYAEKLARDNVNKVLKDETLKLAGSDLDINERKNIAGRITAIDPRFEQDGDGYIYLKGYSVPIPQDLVTAILDATYNPNSQYTLNSLINMWQWVILNPNAEARNDLFGWFKTGNFSITESGFIIAYRCVNIMTPSKDQGLLNFVNENYIKIKKWKKAPKNFGVIEHKGEYTLTDLKKNPDINLTKEFKGSILDLYSDINQSEIGAVYTDNHTGKMKIKIGEPVILSRDKCDENRNASCSRGLHFMSKKYNLRLGKEKLIILINPMNIVAFPSYDNSKGRCCEYLPIGNAEVDVKGDIVEIQSGTFDLEYGKYSEQVLQELIQGKSLKELQTEGVISVEINITDFKIARDTIKASIKNRVVKL